MKLLAISGIVNPNILLNGIKIDLNIAITITIPHKIFLPSLFSVNGDKIGIKQYINKKENARLKEILEGKKIKEINIKLKKENEELKKAIKNNVNMPFDIPLCTIIENEEISDEELEKVIDELEDLTDEKQDMEIISLLSRSKKRLEVLESLENKNKIPSVISKDINDSSHHISKYLKTLKEYGLVVCLNENDKRYRYYSITPKGTKYLNIVKNKK
ncbi:winged helix DNA-binding protein [uncultured Methanobrevibacter sp.]|uniref:winged helix DNA-binding protein n=1 Tax=uncultured Methanobrevibacter sp. TaxID=253161 RepID=UPI0025ED9D64|nr:winged helix DNA-binding protein [uncultured Methanobrevibacter sp.]